MATLGFIEYQDASAEVRAVYDDIMRTRDTDWINNFWKALAHDPATLRRTWESIRQIMAPGTLDALTKEMIYLAVSGTIFGTAGYAVVEETFAFPGSMLMQSLTPDLDMWNMIRPCVFKLISNLGALLNELPKLGGGWMGILSEDPAGIARQACPADAAAPQDRQPGRIGGGGGAIIGGDAEQAIGDGRDAVDLLDGIAVDDDVIRSQRSDGQQ